MSSRLVSSHLESLKGDRRDEAMRQTPKMDGYQSAVLLYPGSMREAINLTRNTDALLQHVATAVDKPGRGVLPRR
ncbi:hypothetical protein ACT3XG_18715 [Paenibacillus polymyxa]|nr:MULTISPECIES: hypothetical protein [Paenibacillus]KAF6659686.1 hypothetical protein HFD99_05265 [Paenibacillus sp. EKM301P]MBY7739150.1 hypothetical protein [Paenibacillus polymyxa]UBS86155.1 hypothetical protein LAZ93_18660 [Paenibacillus polymyxa]WHX34685.1 hypothetical protein QNH38_19160 [Paenibacillus polymyxa]